MCQDQETAKMGEHGSNVLRIKRNNVPSQIRPSQKQLKRPPIPNRQPSAESPGASMCVASTLASQARHFLSLLDHPPICSEIQMFSGCVRVLAIPQMAVTLASDSSGRPLSDKRERDQPSKVVEGRHRETHHA
jgi:hypothetical protein